VKITRIIKHYNIKSRFSIRIARLKNCMQNAENQRQILYNILFRNEQSKRNRQSEDETLFAKLLQLSAK
jgi:hypothetical protein